MSTPPPLGMSAPPPPPPPPPAPSRKGCFIAIGVTLVVLLLACLAGCVLIAKSPGRAAAWSLNMSRTQFVAAVASDVPADQRAAFETEFGAYIEWLRAAGPETFKTKGQAPIAPVQYLQGAMQDKSITADEVERFLEMSRELRGVATPEPPMPEPAPVPMPEATAPMEGSAPADGTPIEGTSPDGTSAPAPGTP